MGELEPLLVLVLEPLLELELLPLLELEPEPLLELLQLRSADRGTSQWRPGRRGR